MSIRHRPLLSSALGLALGLGSLQVTATDELRLDDSAREALGVTIYNDDLALVRDRRRVELDAGENRIAWRNVSAEIRPQTALLSTPEDGALRLLEQNFDYDLLTPESLLQKYVGREVEVVRTNAAGERTRERARVLAANGGVVLRYSDRIETAVIGHLVYPDVPADLRDQPTLVLHLETADAGERTLELSYLSGGLSWQADYVAELDPEQGDHMTLNAWVTLDNRSGVAYRDARIQLVAGALNQVREQVMALPVMRAERMMADSAIPKREQLDAYHLYTLPRRTDLLNHQTKQVALFTAEAIPVERLLVVSGRPVGARNGDGWSTQPVRTTLSFTNDTAGPNMPLPRGVIRVYAQDSAGHAQFVGEDAIDHTPTDQRITLTLGESFDVTARRRQTDLEHIGDDGTVELGFELELANAREAATTVEVRERISGDWQMLEETTQHIKAAADLAVWHLEVPAKGRITLSWRVRIER
ncbi:DUF4139 domain-containing protein [Marichromatium bheemlicum]|uniref:DUF4139 domain-containing protein n=1 Tax=Marichromatium bheemlicum TaxID=365339 RepID=A0ABX1I6R2_9GAMM|nr:DUF4139 domain-containing protein [Marichromatium bheemlicum]NKN33260.1 DUF4139 domain-containing protein [Marichromatium bheemlicum]